MPFSFEEANQLYKSMPAWLKEFLNFLFEDKDVNTIMRSEEAVSNSSTWGSMLHPHMSFFRRVDGHQEELTDINYLSRILDPLFITIKTPKEIREFLLNNPFYLFFLSEKTFEEFQIMLDLPADERQKVMQSEIDQSFGTTELPDSLCKLFKDTCESNLDTFKRDLNDAPMLGQSIFAQYEQGKIFKWIEALADKVYMMFFNEKGEIRKEIFEALDSFKNATGENISGRMPKTMSEDIFSNILDIVHRPLVGLLRTYVSAVIPDSVDGLFRYYVFDQALITRLDRDHEDASNLKPHELPLAEAMMFCHNSHNGTKFYYETKLRVLSRQILVEVFGRISLLPTYDPNAVLNIKKWFEEYDQLEKAQPGRQKILLETIAQLTYFKQENKWLETKELEIYLSRYKFWLTKNFVYMITQQITDYRERQQQFLFSIKIELLEADAETESFKKYLDFLAERASYQDLKEITKYMILGCVHFSITDKKFIEFESNQEIKDHARECFYRVRGKAPQLDPRQVLWEAYEAGVGQAKIMVGFILLNELSSSQEGTFKRNSENLSQQEVIHELEKYLGENQNTAISSPSTPNPPSAHKRIS